MYKLHNKSRPMRRPKILTDEDLDRLLDLIKVEIQEVGRFYKPGKVRDQEMSEWTALVNIFTAWREVTNRRIGDRK